MANNTNTTPMVAPECPTINLDNYTCSNALLLPILNEYTWSAGTRIVLYLVAMVWCFLGVALIADVFMCAIEKITSKTAKVRIPDQNEPDGFRMIEVKVWNDTVANLSLLALGTSAPEILLSVIEIVGRKFESGELGPGTIVGSAAFNLLVISAICILSIPDGETRRIANMRVFGLTTFSCIWAYVWLSLVILVISPGVVDLYEAIITFLMFPALIIGAYLIDKKPCMKKEEAVENGMVGISLEGYANEPLTTDEKPAAAGEEKEKPSNKNLLKLAKELGHESLDQGIPPEEAAKIVAAKLSEKEHHSRMWYRINATRNMSGGRKLVPQVYSAFKDLYDHTQLPEDEKSGGKMAIMTKDHTAGGTKAVVEFTAATVSVLESEKKVRIGIRRYGKMDTPATVRVETINGTATAPEDYIHLEQEVSFASNELLRQLYVEIIDDNEWEPDEFFFVKLSLPEKEENTDIVLGNVSISQVTIINDDEPGKLEFAKPSIIAKESSRRVRIPVNRVNGADGHVSVAWKTRDITAISGKDYEGGEGVLKFDHGETSRTIDIEIFDSMKPERDESFQVELGECDGGAELAKIKKTIITIVNDEEFNGLVSRIVNLTKANMDALQLEDSTWVTQMKNAMNVNGGDIENATFIDYLLHFLTFFWKILFALVPPPKYLGGWPAFILSLAVIGFMTAIIGDLASLFGCLVDLNDSITAITLVALGTSMPDTFASKQAAVGEKTADSSVGNINGSNSVNVFLGLGLPWLMATIYHTSQGTVFTVPPGSLGFSVILYTACAVVAICVLVARRFLKPFGQAELGGPKGMKIVSAIILVSLWVFYILLSSLNAEKIINVQIGGTV
ncbi:sodium/calcium exchanger 3-like isoform X2 [Ostrea edulis]|uniref:sodium/calcium exchanger 3-like isoform X2 n=1 Tax=Ostrea edulis TaxID=37623 RepID=UPI0024AE9F4C|nr:sodium/calcium exchanger 3-like isoform X2 [Ostrea edulis]XP_056017580.1 sodium/calcium exchanger 3-like isoform X2 [Ostrea edulis]XP_056017581.1 sodium/calcium exchanger 3-like isoform X2 [Ostrea edulis]